MGYVRFTPSSATEAETACPPFNIRCRWLVGKLILKSLAHSNHNIFDIYYSLIITCRYTSKSIPVLSIAVNTLFNFHLYTKKSNKLQLYGQHYDSLLLVPSFKLITYLICLILSINQCLIMWLITLFQITSTLIFPTTQ